MSRPALALLIATTLSGCTAVTEVVVSIDSHLSGLDAPSRLRLVAGANAAAVAGGIEFLRQEVVPCDTAALPGCVSYPVSVALVPGAMAPTTPVRIQLDALAADGSLLSSDASVFSFALGERGHLDFLLSPACLHTSCATHDLACDPSGVCEQRGPSQGTREAAGRIDRLLSIGNQLTEAASFSIPPPTNTRAGDLIFLLVASSIPISREVASSAWKVQHTGGPVLLVKRASDDELARTSDYAFTPGGAHNSVGLVTAVYRGATELVPGAVQRLPAGASFTPPPLTASRAGALQLLFIAASHDVTCSGPSQPILVYDGAYSVHRFYLFEVGEAAAGPASTPTVHCDGPESFAFQQLLVP